MVPLTPDIWKRLEFFREEEFTRPEKMDEDFLQMLDDARHFAGTPFVINSSWRDPGNDVAGNHCTGKAVDIACEDSTKRFNIVFSLLSAGFRRIGIYSTHIHADSNHDNPHPVIWLDPEWLT